MAIPPIVLVYASYEQILTGLGRWLSHRPEDLAVGAGGARRWLLASRGSIGLAGKGRFTGALVPLDSTPVIRQPDCLPETQQMPMDAERPFYGPRPTTRHQTASRPADSFVHCAGLTPNELAICRSGGCRVIRAGRGAEIALDRSASSSTREVWRKPAGLPLPPDGIHWRQRPGSGGLQCIRSFRPGRSTRHHPMLEASY